MRCSYQWQTGADRSMKHLTKKTIRYWHSISWFKPDLNYLSLIIETQVYLILNLFKWPTGILLEPNLICKYFFFFFFLYDTWLAAYCWQLVNSSTWLPSAGSAPWGLPPSNSKSWFHVDSITRDVFVIVTTQRLRWGKQIVKTAVCAIWNGRSNQQRMMRKIAISCNQTVMGICLGKNK